MPNRSFQVVFQHIIVCCIAWFKLTRRWTDVTLSLSVSSLHRCSQVNSVFFTSLWKSQGTGSFAWKFVIALHRPLVRGILRCYLSCALYTWLTIPRLATVCASDLALQLTKCALQIIILNWVKMWWGAGVVICLERDADLHIAQLMPLPLTVSCFSKMQTGFTFLVLAHPGGPGQRAVQWVCVFVS